MVKKMFAAVLCFVLLLGASSCGTESGIRKVGQRRILWTDSDRVYSYREVRETLEDPENGSLVSFFRKYDLRDYKQFPRGQDIVHRKYHYEIADANQHEHVADLIESPHEDVWIERKPYYYTVLQTDRGMLQIFWDETMQTPYYRNFHFSEDSDEENMEKIFVGMDVSTVMKLDPAGAYDFLYADWVHYPRVSYHYFRDGVCYRIQYSQFDYIVLEILRFTI